MADEITPPSTTFGEIKQKDTDAAEDNFFRNTPDSSADASNIMAEKASKDYAEVNKRDEQNDKRIRNDPSGDNTDPLAPYRYVGDEKIAQALYDADNAQKEEITSHDSVWGRIQEVVNELEGKNADGSVSDDGPNLYSDTTSEAISLLNHAIRLLRERQINAVSQTLLETGNDAAETEKIREEFGVEPKDPASK